MHRENRRGSECGVGEGTEPGFSRAGGLWENPPGTRASTPATPAGEAGATAAGGLDGGGARCRLGASPCAGPGGARGFAAVQEPWPDNRRHARQGQRGARYLLQGVGQCQQGGDAYDGKHLSPRGRQGQPRAYASSRCLGTDAYRFGGARVWQNTPVRTDRLDVAVWQEVWTLLAHPERLVEE